MYVKAADVMQSRVQDLPKFHSPNTNPKKPLTTQHWAPRPLLWVFERSTKGLHIAQCRSYL